jgi:hypothetical protein
MKQTVYNQHGLLVEILLIHLVELEEGYQWRVYIWALEAEALEKGRPTNIEEPMDTVLLYKVNAELGAGIWR